MSLHLSPSTGSSQDDKITCKICKRQFAHYTCPRCNVAYCSITCFRAESHSQCSEAFYRSEIDSNIRTQPSRTVEERQKMLALLKRFEESASENAGEFSQEEEEEEDLEKRFDELNLETASFDDLWSKLGLRERKTFSDIIADPTSERARELLTLIETEREIREPWWEAGFQDGDHPDMQKYRFGVQPTLMPIPANMVKLESERSILIYNITAIFLAYAYTTRQLCTSPLSSLGPRDPDREEAKRLMVQVAPFLMDRKSRTRYTSLSDVLTDFWSNFDSMTESFMSVLLRDMAHLLRPSLVTELGNPPSASELFLDESVLKLHPSCAAVRALSDLSRIFEIRDAEEKGLNQIKLKLTFYAAHILSVPTVVLASLADELSTRSVIVQNEPCFS